MNELARNIDVGWSEGWSHMVGVSGVLLTGTPEAAEQNEGGEDEK
jgi:hypothetical protein